MRKNDLERAIGKEQRKKTNERIGMNEHEIARAIANEKILRIKNK